jgi:DNA-binding beta-propeller fold protein YncE
VLDDDVIPDYALFPRGGLCDVLPDAHSLSVATRVGRGDVIMTRRKALKLAILTLAPMRVSAAPSVSTIIGTGTPGNSNTQVNNPYGVIIGPDGALYFCDLDNQRIRRLDLKTRRTVDIAGNGQRGYAGDGGPATQGSLNMPHELVFDARGDLYIAERDNHAIRKIDRATGMMTTVAGTGAAGFSGDGGPAARAALRSPHSIAIAPDGRLLICDVGNHRVRAVDLTSGAIETIGGTGERLAAPDGAPLKGTPLNGPRTLAIDRDGSIYLALREGNALYRIAPRTGTIHHLAGTGEQGYSGDGGPARHARLAGPKGLALAGRRLYVADTENHVIRCVDLDGGLITTVLGTGARGDGPETNPLQCKLARPHGLFADTSGNVYVADSEAHRIRVLVTAIN